MPGPDLSDMRVNRLDCWQLVNFMFQKIWKRYSTEYLLYLQARSKWKVRHRCVQADDLVLLVDEEVIPCYWKLGCVVTLYPGRDGIVRVEDVRPRLVHFADQQ